MTAINGNSIVNSSSVLSSGVVSVDHLTPDSLFFYLQDRLEGIDTQVKAAFDKQRAIETLKKDIMAVQNVLSGLEKGVTAIPKNDGIEIAVALEQLRTTDPRLAEKLSTSLPEEFLMTPDTKPGDMLKRVEGANSLALTENTLEGACTTFKNALSDLDSSAQLEMIQLQSSMSTRQTAIQLCTNLVSALGKGNEAIAANIGH
jgi:hypothetical protein